MNNLEVSFTLQEIDFRRLFLRRMLRRKMAIILLFFMLVIFTLLLLNGIETRSVPVLVFVFVYLVAVFGLGGVVIPRSRYLKERRQGKINETKVSISPIEMNITTEELNMSVKWSQIRKVKQNRHFIFIFVNKQNNLAVPRRAFPSLSESENFFSHIHDYIGVAKRNT